MCNWQIYKCADFILDVQNSRIPERNRFKILLLIVWLKPSFIVFAPPHKWDGNDFSYETNSKLFFIAVWLQPTATL